MGDCTVSFEETVTPPEAAEMVGLPLLPEIVVTVKVTDVWPAATKTVAGTVATAVLSLDNVTVRPSVGAAAITSTFPCTVLPLRVVEGVRSTQRESQWFPR